MICSMLYITKHKPLASSRFLVMLCLTFQKKFQTFIISYFRAFHSLCIKLICLYLFSGLDFAWAINGYVYHTKLDNAEHVSVKSLQRTGDNLLPLTLKLANLNYPNDSPQKGNLVFFDVLGIFLFRVPELTGVLINITVILYSLYVLSKNASNNSASTGTSIIKNQNNVLIDWFLLYTYQS